MELSTWITVATICLLGAMSPGPSVALVLKHTVAQGRRQGVITALSHGLGIGSYALLSVLGLSAAIAASDTLFTIIRWAGALFLAWIGIQGLLAKENTTTSQSTSSNHPARDGLLMAFLNPKAAIFFVALFSQIVTPDTSLIAKLGYAATAMVIDMSWYAAVAWTASQQRFLSRFSRYQLWFERLFGIILLLVAAEILWAGA